jgi:hypothetical protein
MVMTDADPSLVTENFRESWAEYARRRNFLLLVFVGYIPWGLLVFLLKRRLGLSESVIGVLILVWFLAFPVAIIRYTFWKCPRCEKAFAYKWPVNKSYFVRKCSHCGLAKAEIRRVAKENSSTKL